MKITTSDFADVKLRGGGGWCLNCKLPLFHLIGIETLVSTLKEMTYLPNRKKEGELVFSVDHCFSIKGQGTVLTGTILQGNVKINDVSWSHIQEYSVVCTVER